MTPQLDPMVLCYTSLYSFGFEEGHLKVGYQVVRTHTVSCSAAAQRDPRASLSASGSSRSCTACSCTPRSVRNGCGYKTSTSSVLVGRLLLSFQLPSFTFAFTVRFIMAIWNRELTFLLIALTAQDTLRVYL